jgi:superfamily I DNA/RNA helicase
MSGFRGPLYSNNAAVNMETKLQKEFAVNNVRCSTIHAFGLSIIMEHYQLLGFTTKLTLETKRLSKQLALLIKKVASANNVEPKHLRHAVYKVIRKDRNIGRIKQDTDLAELVAEVLKQYQKVKLRNNWIDYEL